MVAGHVRAELRLQVGHQRAESLGRIAEVLRGGHHSIAELRVAIPDHHVVGMRLQPPLRRVHADTRNQKGIGIRIQDLSALGVGHGPVDRLPRARPRQIDRKAHKRGPCLAGHPDLRLVSIRGPAQEDVRIAWPVEGDRHLAGGLGAGPKAHAVPMVLSQGQVGVMIDVEIGPIAAGRGPERHVQTGRPVAPAAPLHFDLADRVSLCFRPDIPPAGEGGRSRFEIAPRKHVMPVAEVLHADVVEVDGARRLPEAKVHGGDARLVLGGLKLEDDRPARRLDRLRLGSRRPPEHPRPHRLPVDHQARSPRCGIDPHRFRRRKRTTGDTHE
jgi:hypothetical protein